MQDVTYSDVLRAAEGATTHPYDYRYVVITLAKGDVLDNPASTKRRVYGPGTWVWEIHPSAVHAREYDSITSVPPEIVAGAARIPA